MRDIDRSDRAASRAPAAGVAAVLALLLASLPFIASGDVGLLGVGLVNDDMASHLLLADWIETGFRPEPVFVDQGYPLGPALRSSPASRSLLGDRAGRGVRGARARGPGAGRAHRIRGARRAAAALADARGSPGRAAVPRRRLLRAGGVQGADPGAAGARVRAAAAGARVGADGGAARGDRRGGRLRLQLPRTGLAGRDGRRLGGASCSPRGASRFGGTRAHRRAPAAGRGVLVRARCCPTSAGCSTSPTSARSTRIGPTRAGSATSAATSRRSRRSGSGRRASSG